MHEVRWHILRINGLMELHARHKLSSEEQHVL